MTSTLQFFFIWILETFRNFGHVHNQSCVFILLTFSLPIIFPRLTIFLNIKILDFVKHPLRIARLETIHVAKLLNVFCWWENFYWLLLSQARRCTFWFSAWWIPHTSLWSDFWRSDLKPLKNYVIIYKIIHSPEYYSKPVSEHYREQSQYHDIALQIFQIQCTSCSLLKNFLIIVCSNM